MGFVVEYDKEENVIRSVCPEVLDAEDLRAYFEQLLARKGEIREAHEHVDFSNVRDFAVSQDLFRRIKSS